MNRSWRRVGIGAGVVALVFVALVAFAHTPWGRPLLGMLSGVPGCPAGAAGLEGGDAAAIEARRQAALRDRTAQSLVPPRVAAALIRPGGQGTSSSLVLGVTTRAELLAWLGPAAASCRSIRDGQVLKCETPRSDGGPTIVDMHLQLDGDRLVAVDLFRAPAPAPVALAHLAATAGALTSAVGPATAVSGVDDPDWIIAAPVRRVAHTFRYSGYVAEVSALNLGARGVRIREQYQWAER